MRPNQIGHGRLRGKVALITGGASGIGRASCLLFAREGATVIASDRDVAGLRDLETLAGVDGLAVTAVPGDVRLTADAARIVDEVIARAGRLDVLFSNAGIEFVGAVHETPEDQWDLLLDTNLKAAYQLARFAVPHMIRQGGGVIINTASQLGLVAAPNFAAYCASKGGLVNLTRAMALDLAPHHIRVNALCPGAVETPLLLRQFEKSSGPQGTLEDLKALHAMKRLAQPDEIAYPALFLASDEASFMTGAALVVDGGYTAW